MKKLTILLFVFILTLVGCSKGPVTDSESSFPRAEKNLIHDYVDILVASDDVEEKKEFVQENIMVEQAGIASLLLGARAKEKFTSKDIEILKRVEVKREEKKIVLYLIEGKTNKKQYIQALTKQEGDLRISLPVKEDSSNFEKYVKEFDK